MPLLVVPLGPHEMDLLTLGELDELASCERVLFEQPQHPLRKRLESAAVDCGELEGEPKVGATQWAVVTDPGSLRVLEFARNGARVSFSGVIRPPDDLTTAHAAPIIRRAATALAGVVAVMARLRSEDGCPWDQEQTHESLKIHLLEEAHEVIEAIDSAESQDLAEELGDLLLQVVFHSRLAEQEGRFDISEVASALTAKLVLRHPHVFSDLGVSGAAEVLANWETIKSTEKGRSHPFDGIPRTLPALLKTAKMQKRAAPLGFRASEQEALRRLASAVADEVTRESLGEALFWLVALARAQGVDPEGALASHLEKFRASLPAP
jgi:tetrapyrrole methylase family protein / MazG family protein